MGIRSDIKRAVKAVEKIVDSQRNIKSNFKQPKYLAPRDVKSLNHSVT